MSLRRKRIAAFVPNVLKFSPGQRVRIELWEQALGENGWDIEYFPFEDDSLHEVLYRPGNILRKVAGLARCYKRQLRRIGEIDADVIFIYREAALVGPAIIERLIRKRSKLPIVLDLDDPVFIPYVSPANSFASLLKFSRKTHTLFRLSSRVIAINELIGDYARAYNPNVTVIPNAIDTEKYRLRVTQSGERPRFVWIGSQSTMVNLTTIREPLLKLEDETDAKLLVIGSGESDLGLKRVEWRQWSADTEVSDLSEGNIGLLPLTDLSWNHWKFFFKAIQYMAVGIPVVARRMGSNSEVVQDGVNGYLVDSQEEWFDRLKALATNEDLRAEMGLNARKSVEAKFSTAVQTPRIVEVFENLLVRS